MRAGVRIPYNGQTVDADEMDFKADGPAVLVLRIEDGTVLEVKHDASAVYRLREKAPDGTPLPLDYGRRLISFKKDSTANPEGALQ